VLGVVGFRDSEIFSLNYTTLAKVNTETYIYLYDCTYASETHTIPGVLLHVFDNRSRVCG